MHILDPRFYLASKCIYNSLHDPCGITCHLQRSYKNNSLYPKNIINKKGYLQRYLKKTMKLANGPSVIFWKCHFNGHFNPLYFPSKTLFACHFCYLTRFLSKFILLSFPWCPSSSLTSVSTMEAHHGFVSNWIFAYQHDLVDLTHTTTLPIFSFTIMTLSWS